MNKKLQIVQAVLLLGLLVVSGSADGSEVRVSRLGDKAAVFQAGGADSTNVLALASRRGLVVVDTGLLPAQGQALRAAIEREFRRRDFAYIINTHAHFDHTDGNQAFADVPIVGHANAAREMARWYGTKEAREGFIKSRSASQAQLEGDLKKAAPGSAEAADLRESAANNAALVEAFRSGELVPTPPTVLFNDRLTLDLGDLTLNLVYFGPAHTTSDILVHVPELRLLATGDVFHKRWLPQIEGPVDPARWLRVLASLPSGSQAVETIIPGHDAFLTGDELRAREAYVKSVWDGVASARREGLTLAAAKAGLPFDVKNPLLAGLVRSWQGQDFHAANIDAVWRLQSESASRALESLIAARGWEAAAAEYRKTIAGHERYNVVENELNALGYRYLHGGRIPEAVTVFVINTEAFPKSWNVWNSLGEAYMESGDRGKSDACYAKSLALNPQDAGAKDSLEETREPARFKPGEKTGLKGLYFGQTPPGLVPKVFAPGIVSSYGYFDFSITFSPDGREIYFTRRKDGESNTLMAARLGTDGWTAPEAAAFAQGGPACEPHVTPDGRKLFYGSGPGIRVVDRTPDGGWSEPRSHGPGMYVTSARNGNLYMTDVTNVQGGGPAVIVYPRVEGGYGPPQRVGGGVNTPAVADHAFIAPDESYILFDSSRPGGQGGEGDLYVCFRKPDGGWGEAINLGDAINHPGLNFCPSVSPDGKYVFFTSQRDIYWVSADILAPLRPKG